MNNSLRGLGFTLLVLILALIAQADRDNLQEASFQEKIQDSSVAFATKSAFKPASRSSRLPAALPNFSVGTLQKVKDVEPPVLTVSAGFAADLKSGAELFNFNGQAQWAIASLTKLMTAVVASENVGTAKNIPITEKAFNTEGVAGNLEIGGVYQAGDLLRAMLIVSSNDAAAAIAEFYGEENFLEAMKRKAVELGMAQTNFTDATGLSFLNQATAGDLFKLIKYISDRHPEILAITRQKTAAITEVNSGAVKILNNINYFAGRPDFIGGKTGFIEASQSNLLSVFNHQNHQIFIVIFGAEERFVQTELLYNWIKQVYDF